MDKFLFALGDGAKISCSGETGVIVGRSDYLQGENSYLLRYKSNDHGKAVQEWWNESALEADPPKAGEAKAQ